MTKISTNWCINRSKPNGIQMTMKLHLVSLSEFSSCGRCSDQCNHYSMWHISSALLAVFFRNPLCQVTVGRLPNPSGLLVLCVCRTNRGQPKVTRRFGTVLSTASVVSVLQGTRSELLLNLLQPSRTEVISVTTNWGDRHTACCSSRLRQK